MISSAPGLRESGTASSMEPRLRGPVAVGRSGACSAPEDAVSGRPVTACQKDHDRLKDTTTALSRTMRFGGTLRVFPRLRGPGDTITRCNAGQEDVPIVYFR